MVRVLCALALLLSACSSCDDDHEVPFRLDAGRRHAPVPPPPPELETAIEGQELGAGTRNVLVEGAPIEIDGAIRALLAHDLDGDGDRDAIAVASSGND